MTILYILSNCYKVEALPSIRALFKGSEERKASLTVVMSRPPRYLCQRARVSSHKLGANDIEDFLHHAAAALQGMCPKFEESRLTRFPYS